MGGSYSEKGRLSRDEHDRLALAMVDSLPDYPVQTIGRLGNKECFGDIDFVVHGNVFDFENYILTKYQPTVFKTNNTSVYSENRKKVEHKANSVNIVVDGVQYDFFVSSSRSVVQFLKGYHDSYLGHLLQYLSEIMGLWLHQDSLVRTEVYNGRNMVVTVTNDFNEALNILGLPPKPLNFSDEKVLFKYITSSRNFNAIAMKSNGRRHRLPIGEAFAEHCRAIPDEDYRIDLVGRTHRMLDSDPQYLANRKAAIKNVENIEKRVAKNKLSGKLIVSLLGNNIPLKEFIIAIKTKYPNIESLDLAEIKELVVTEHSIFNIEESENSYDQAKEIAYAKRGRRRNQSKKERQKS